MMGHEKSNKFSYEMRLLAEKADAFGIGLSSSELRLFQRYLEELWAWSRRFNLTGLKTRERMVIELFLDSLIPSPFLPEKAMVLDVGSGAGFPGLPLKIRHPGLNMHLLEKSAKKASFLKQVIRALSLRDIDVIQERVEAHPRRSGYGVITSRAAASLKQTLAWCSPLLASGGLLVVFLGAEGERDMVESEKEVTAGGLEVAEMISYVLPGRKTARTTYILKKPNFP